MIGMSFPAFLILLILGFIGAFVMHVFIGYRMLNGLDGFLSKWVAGWLGAWLASPVLGHWAPQFAGVYILPAILGAFIGPFMMTALFKVSAITAAPRQSMAAAPAAAMAQPLEMKKAS